MRRVGLLVSLSFVLMASGCGSSGDGGTGGAGGKGGSATGGSHGGTGGSGTGGGAGGKGGAAGTGAGGSAGAGGGGGAGGSGGGAGGVAGAQGGHAGAGTGGSAGTSGGAGAAGNAGAGGASGGGAGGSAGTGGGTAGAGGATTDGGTMCGDGNGSSRGDGCNATPANGPCVTPMLFSGTPPTPMGGAIEAGTYNLFSDFYYGPLDAAFSMQGYRQTLVFSDVTSSSLTLDQVGASGTATNRSHGTVALSGTSVTYTPTCPATDAGGGDTGGSASYSFTSNGTNAAFVLIQQNHGMTEVSTFIRAN
ncbi:MAG TPA: hypothetical protein VMT03_03845 [Polyangia bacterium]|nr:hypothetical protein [Polyangia bacterium]